MPGFIKVVSADTRENGIVSAKTYRTIQEALTGKLRFGVIRAQGVGDVLMSAIVVDAIKREHPDSEITFYSFAQHLPLLKKFPFIDRVETLENIDTSAIMIDLMGKIDYLPLCAKAYRVDLLADEASVPRAQLNYDLSFSPSEEETAWAVKLLRGLKVGAKDRVIAIHLKSFADIRTWDAWPELVHLILKEMPKQHKVLLLEKEFVECEKSPRVINLTGKVSLMETMALLPQCALLVCPDSGFMHMAGMMRVPFIGLFGPIDPDFRIRYYPTGEAIWLKDQVPCAPCWDWQTRSCKHDEKYKLCMRSITPEMVFERLRLRVGVPKRRVRSAATGRVRAGAYPG